MRHPNKIVFEDRIDPADVQIEDSGNAKIARLADGRDEGVFIEIHSWSEPNPGRHKRPKHPEFDRLIGKRVRVTIEEIR